MSYYLQRFIGIKIALCQYRHILPKHPKVNTPPILGITKDDGKSNLGIYKVYDFTKRVTDIIDQRMGFSTCKPKSRKFAITVFNYVIDMTRVNSSTTFALQNKYYPCKQDSFEYCYTLLYQLVKPFIKSGSLNGLTSFVRQKIELVIGKRQKVEGETLLALQCFTPLDFMPPKNPGLIGLNKHTLCTFIIFTLIFFFNFLTNYI